MPNLGMWEILLILLIALLVFGAKRLPEMGAAMGKGIREFKRSIRDVQESIPESDTSSAGPARQIDTAARSGEPKKLSQ